MHSPSPFHEGEQRVQSMLGVREAIEPWARQVVRPVLPEEHRAFHTSLPFIVAAARDGQGRPWVTLLTGPEGFIRSPDPRHLRIAAQPLPGDALETSLKAGTELGLLGIELATRRRNRVNGQLVEDGSGGLVFEVGQSFGNCPQYIHAREWHRATPLARTSPPARHRRFTEAMRQWISAADTLFIGSGHRGEGEHAGFGMDASHRGGSAGFVRVESDTRLVIPDYAGNNHYNTIGNLIMDPRAALLFVDFERGSLLQLSGRTAIDWDSDALARHPGARRLVIFELEEAVELREVLPIRWNTSTGAVRSLCVIAKRRESKDVTSFVLAARDDAPLAGFEPGQHLPLELRIPGRARTVDRTYSLSGSPGDPHYRISVKRERHGVASGHLHDGVNEGDIINARLPAGDFVLGHEPHPVVLIGAGIGVTPLLSMFHALAADTLGREAWLIHGVRDGDHHPLVEDARALARDSDRLHLHVVYSRPTSGDRASRRFDTAGRVDGALVHRLLGTLDAEFYLCGPTGFMANLQADLVARGVSADRVHTETFGPSA